MHVGFTHVKYIAMFYSVFYFSFFILGWGYAYALFGITVLT